MTEKIFFPTGIVTGNAFCNRISEREYLKLRLEQNTHVVLISPRRYGKSSLIAQFTRDQKIPFSAVDLLPATSSRYVKNAIIDGVTQLLDRIMPPTKKSKQKIMGYFSNMNPVIELSAFGQKLTLKPDEKTPEETIMKLLLSLDSAAKELNVKLIFVMDEFQQIATLDSAHSLEACIRHAVERSKHVFYIFSGSNRTLLEDMFSNKDRPLYHLCDEMKLKKIDSSHYTLFIKKASKQRWKTELNELSIKKILELTACHPYYVNRLCRMLWDNETPPSLSDIEHTWQDYCSMQNTDWISDMLSQLTANQRAILAALAKEPEKMLSSKSFSERVSLPASSIQRAIPTLAKKDLLYEDTDGSYHVLNPTIQYILSENKYFS